LLQHGRHTLFPQSLPEAQLPPPQVPLALQTPGLSPTAGHWPLVQHGRHTLFPQSLVPIGQLPATQVPVGLQMPGLSPCLAHCVSLQHALHSPLQSRNGGLQRMAHIVPLQVAMPPVGAGQKAQEAPHDEVALLSTHALPQR
jgi:hypothetical protein